MSKTTDIMITSSIQEGLEYVERFPKLLEKTLIMSHLTPVSQVEGLRVGKLYLTETVDKNLPLIEALYRSLVMGTNGRTRPWPMVLQKNWKEV